MPNTDIILQTRYSCRNDTAVNWTSKNPALLKGEIGVEIDTSKFKIGDGRSYWKDLPYANITQPEMDEILEDIRGLRLEPITEDAFNKLPEKDPNTLYLLV